MCSEFSSYSAGYRLSRALSSVWHWAKCNCTPARILGAMFSAPASMAVMLTFAALIWWFNITIDSVAEAQRRIAVAAMCAMPWAIVWVIRATVMSMPKKGGRA